MREIDRASHHLSWQVMWLYEWLGDRGHFSGVLWNIADMLWRPAVADRLRGDLGKAPPLPATTDHIARVQETRRAITEVRRRIRAGDATATPAELDQAHEHFLATQKGER